MQTSQHGTWSERGCLAGARDPHGQIIVFVAVKVAGSQGFHKPIVVLSPDPEPVVQTIEHRRDASSTDKVKAPILPLISGPFAGIMEVT
jgi:hypothetical protein